LFFFVWGEFVMSWLHHGQNLRESPIPWGKNILIPFSSPRHYCTFPQRNCLRQESEFRSQSVEGYLSKRRADGFLFILNTAVARGCRVQPLGSNTLAQKRSHTWKVYRGFCASVGGPMGCAIAPRATAVFRFITLVRRTRHCFCRRDLPGCRDIGRSGRV